MTPRVRTPLTATEPLKKFRDDLVVVPRTKGAQTAYRLVDQKSSKMFDFELYELEYAVAMSLDGGRSAEDIVKHLAQTGFTVSAKQVLSFYRELAGMGFVADEATAKASGNGAPASLDHSTDATRFLREAAAYLGQGKIDFARQYYRAALSIDPTNRTIRDGLAECDKREAAAAEALGRPAPSASGTTLPRVPRPRDPTDSDWGEADDPAATIVDPFAMGTGKGDLPAELDDTEASGVIGSSVGDETPVMPMPAMPHGHTGGTQVLGSRGTRTPRPTPRVITSPEVTEPAEQAPGIDLPPGAIPYGVAPYGAAPYGAAPAGPAYPRYTTPLPNNYPHVAPAYYPPGMMPPQGPHTPPGMMIPQGPHTPPGLMIPQGPYTPPGMMMAPGYGDSSPGMQLPMAPMGYGGGASGAYAPILPTASSKRTLVIAIAIGVVLLAAGLTVGYVVFGRGTAAGKLAAAEAPKSTGKATATRTPDHPSMPASVADAGPRVIATHPPDAGPRIAATHPPAAVDAGPVDDGHPSAGDGGATPTPSAAAFSATILHASRPSIAITAPIDGEVTEAPREHKHVHGGERLFVISQHHAPSKEQEAAATEVTEMEKLAKKDPVYKDFLERARKKLASLKGDGDVSRPVRAPHSGTVEVKIASGKVAAGQLLATVGDESRWTIDARSDSGAAGPTWKCEVVSGAHRAPCEIEKVHARGKGSELTAHATVAAAPWLGDEAHGATLALSPP